MGILPTAPGDIMSTTIDRHEAKVEQAFPEVRSVGLEAPWRWLQGGLEDLHRGGGASLFYGACYTLCGWLLYLVFQKAYALFAGLTTGFLLLGPLLAMGLYDISRRLERGETPRLQPTLSCWRPNLANLGVFAGVLAVVMLLWARASMVVFALFFDGGLPTFGDVLRALFAFQQPEFALVYFIVGGFFAAFVFAIGIIAVPLMLDRGTDAVTAGLASIAACARNPGPLLLWAACIAVLVGLSMATLFLGLIVVMPLLGHGTWHAYRDLVAPEPPPARAPSLNPQR